MRMVPKMKSCLEGGKPVNALLDECWEPTRPWYFYEFFGPSFVLIAETNPATADDLMVFGFPVAARRDRRNAPGGRNR